MNPIVFVIYNTTKDTLSGEVRRYRKENKIKKDKK